MANVVFIQDENGNVVDEVLYCSDTCAKSDVWYAGWYGCVDNYTTPFCPNCGTAMYWTDENTNTHYLGNEEEKMSEQNETTETPETPKNYGKIVIPYAVDVEEFWSCVMGSGWEDASWWRTIKYHDGTAWDKPGSFTIGCENPDDEDEIIKKTFNIDDLVRGYSLALEDGFHHCGEKIDWQNLDFCGSDGILQYAFFGKLIYG